MKLHIHQLFFSVHPEALDVFLKPSMLQFNQIWFEKFEVLGKPL